ncbi:class I SAM-dependent methyltransferase [Pleomorphovibrio marinus]|uniref:class I SAM-dependent methyltransferase n=1 Tax=Pleomorphovibrio marinus TaxID=2164132 RepID=UPI000E0AF9C4|nr:class I SAM-dependent methyltransferase [Pleomorphovibrio marinus]
MSQKSTVDEIRERFDKDVERFSNLETGQESIMDAPLAMELITQAAVTTNPNAKNLLDIGCGAGNFTLNLLPHLSQLNCDMVDLSEAMLKKAFDRVSWGTTGKVNLYQEDIRKVKLPDNHYDIILATAVLHHLRDDQDWEQVFQKIHQLLVPGGSLWISDLVVHDDPELHKIMWTRYGRHLISVGGESYRDKVFKYIEVEDTPRSLSYQVHLMEKVGFKQIEILHKNCCFASFGGVK